jgi:CheY-like chemotaxis protein
MSHELRTPLNSIIGFSEVLNRKMYGPINEKQEDYLHDIIGSGRHLLSLINDILDISKVEAGRMDLELSRFSLATILENGQRMVRETALRYGVTLELEVDPVIGEIHADERKIKQVMFNLLSNAVKFSSQGGVVKVSAQRTGDEIQVAVGDTGIGISPEDQAHIFEEFHRAGRKDVRDREGTGLGLAVAKRMVELHGGRIWVESQPGAGSTFTFTLPTERDRVTAPSSILSPAVVLSARDQAAPTVLVVEDDPRAIALVEAVLRSEGYRVVAATRGAEGIDLARREQPGLVILDLLMPEMDGMEVVDRMRADPLTATIPIMIFTAKTVDAGERARLGNRISHLAQKGDFDWPGFVELVRRYYAPQAA